jgi:hypothetical protein
MPGRAVAPAKANVLSDVLVAPSSSRPNRESTASPRHLWNQPRGNEQLAGRHGTIAATYVRIRSGFGSKQVMENTCVSVSNYPQHPPSPKSAH